MNALRRISALLNSEGLPTLFLDRDGVINRRIEGGYVKTPAEFEFLEGVPQSLALLNKYFSPIIVVTNQQGIGKGLMSEAELEHVHHYMLKTLENKGAHIDRIYHCPALESAKDPCRKPSPGMALRAKKDFPHIRFHHSVMVGDSISDMLFGSRTGMLNVFIGKPEAARKYPGLIHLCFNSLADFTHFIHNFHA